MPFVIVSSSTDGHDRPNLSHVTRTTSISARARQIGHGGVPHASHSTGGKYPTCHGFTIPPFQTTFAGPGLTLNRTGTVIVMPWVVACVVIQSTVLPATCGWSIHLPLCKRADSRTAIWPWSSGNSTEIVPSQTFMRTPRRRRADSWSATWARAAAYLLSAA